MCILVVEDHAAMRSALKDFLQAAYPDTAIVEAADGASALEACATQRPQVVLMDVGLPDANGIELIERIREMLPGTAVIVVSQHADSAFVESAQAAGACAYVAKDRIYRDLLPAIAAARGTEGAGS